MKRSIYIGFDPSEAAAYWVAAASIRRHLSTAIPLNSLELTELQRRGLYTRPHEQRCGQLHDTISNHPMSTEFANSRFLVPHLAKEGWALFIDCDVLIRGALVELFDQADERYAVMCVKHDYQPTSKRKMDGKTQSVYSKKNWSSVMLFNCNHTANQRLTLQWVNYATGRALHGFEWLEPYQIGDLDVRWNYLVGHSHCLAPKIVHWTEGGPWLDEYRWTEYAEEWFAALRLTARYLCPGSLI